MIIFQLPRRESERKNHSLARHADTFAAVETRLSLLSMTFRKYIETGGCCFFAGKVLDELNNVQRLVNNSVEVVLVGRKGEQLKPHEILQVMGKKYRHFSFSYFFRNFVIFHRWPWNILKNKSFHWSRKEIHKQCGMQPLTCVTSFRLRIAVILLVSAIVFKLLFSYHSTWTW